jgi:hypothetical protein
VKQSTDDVTEAGRRATAFLLADIHAISGEYDLLAQQVFA